MNTKKQLRHVERDLNGIIAAISQVSSRRARRARRVAQIATGKITGAATIGGMLMFISAFGSASTGTAIGALSGAAATSAQMYWIGSIFGVGAVAGAIILPVIGAVLGLIAVFVISRAVFGRPRKPAKMQEFEVRALFASLRLAYPITARLIQKTWSSHLPFRRLAAMQVAHRFTSTFGTRDRPPIVGKFSHRSKEKLRAPSRSTA